MTRPVSTTTSPPAIVIRPRLLGVLLPLLLLLPSGDLRSADVAADCDRLRLRLVEMITGGEAYRAEDPRLGPRLQALVRRVVANGRTRDPSGSGLWDTLERERTNRLWREVGRLTASFAKVDESISRLYEMALVHAMPHSPLHQDPELARDIVAAIDFCITQNYHERIEHTGYENWYALELGIPLRLLPTLVLMHDQVPPDRLRYYLSVVDRFSPDPDTVGGHRQPATGANLAWKCRVVAMSAILGRDGQRLQSIAQAMEPLWQEVATGDGFHPDGSFVQHRYFAYTGGYGISALSEPLLVARMLQGSPWAVPAGRVDLMAERFARSFLPVLVDGECMDVVRGREIARYQTTAEDAGAGILRAGLRLQALLADGDQARARTLAAALKHHLGCGGYFTSIPDRPSTVGEDVLAARLLDDRTVVAAPAAVGHHVFAAMDRVVHRAGAWSAALSLSSARIAPFESINGENRRGWHTGSGFLQLFTGDRRQFLDGFWATVDMHRLPGTTVIAGSEPVGERSLATFVGGVALGQAGYGLAVMDHRPRAMPDLHGDAAWFFTPDLVACLGTGWTAPAEARLETIVENRRLSPSVPSVITLSPSATVTAGGGPVTLPAASYLHLDQAGAGLGYVFLRPASVQVLRERRDGAWSDVSTTSLLPVSTAPQTGEYVTAWIDHGRSPHDADYAYVLLPGADRAATARFAVAPTIRVLANQPGVQAVATSDGTVMAAAFRTPGTIGEAPRTVTVDGPCLVLLRRQAGLLQIAVSDPTMSARAPVGLQVAGTSGQAIRSDPGVTMVSDASGLRLRFDLSGSAGATLVADVRSPE